MIVKSLALMVVLLLFIAYYLYADRKIWAAVQLRRGPNVVGPWGLWQSFADLLKFALKEPIVPDGSNKLVFLLAPCVTAIHNSEYDGEADVTTTLCADAACSPFLFESRPGAHAMLNSATTSSRSR